MNNFIQRIEMTTAAKNVFSFFRERFVIVYFYFESLCAGKDWDILLRLAGMGNLLSYGVTSQENSCVKSGLSSMFK